MDALKRIALTDPKRAWLRAHLDAPGCTATEAALAEAAGQPIEALPGAGRANWRWRWTPTCRPSRWNCWLNRAGPGLGAAPAARLRPRRASGAAGGLDARRQGGRDLQPAPGESPIVVLVRPQLADNIGAVARAMANGGLFHLRLVAPRDGWPQEPRLAHRFRRRPRSWRRRRSSPTSPTRVADCHRVFATCPRPRHIIKPLRTARAAAEDCAAINARGLRCARAVRAGARRAGKRRHGPGRHAGPLPAEPRASCR